MTAKRSKGGRRNPRSNRQDQNPFHGGIPRTLTTQLKLNAVYTPTQLNAGSPYGYTRWCPNDLYDPLYDAGGGQAMFRDQLYALYHWARCHSFKFKVTIWSDSATPVMLALIPKQDASAITYTTAAEQPGAKTGVVNVYEPCVLSLHANVDSFLANSRGTSRMDDSFKQQPGAGLATQAQCNVHLYYYFPWSSGLSNLVVQYEIVQDAVFSEVIAQAAS